MSTATASWICRWQTPTPVPQVCCWATETGPFNLRWSTFNPPMIFDSGGYQSASVAVADVNDDGRLDLVALNVCINSLGVVNCGTVDVLLGNGDGTFQPAVSYSNGGGGVGSVAISDVNGDGKPDLVTVSCCGSVVGVLLGNGDGTFQPVITYNPGGAAPEALAIADVND